VNPAAQLRTWLVLGRVSNLPTVWSNALAGWWLGGGGNHWKLPFLFLGLTLLYTAGMFLNDAFDQDSDRQRRAERPIPSGKIPASLVWRQGFIQLGAGVVLLLFCGKVAAVAAMLLALTILLFDVTHKFFTAAPWLMGACRFWVYIIAAAAGTDGLTGPAVFCGFALALYVTGLNSLARRENFRDQIPPWPLLLLAAPVVMALLLNTGDFRSDALCIAAVLMLWLVRCLRTKFFGGEVNRPWIVSNLLAGVVFVDWLAVAPVSSHLASAIIFLALFGLTKWLQKFIPAA